MVHLTKSPLFSTFWHRNKEPAIILCVTHNKVTHSFLLILDQKNSIKNGKEMEVITERKKEPLAGSKRRKERKTGRKNKSVETYSQLMLLT